MYSRSVEEPQMNVVGPEPMMALSVPPLPTYDELPGNAGKQFATYDGGYEPLQPPVNLYYGLHEVQPPLPATFVGRPQPAPPAKSENIYDDADFGDYLDTCSKEDKFQTDA